jgi:hypothetical protein
MYMIFDELARIHFGNVLGEHFEFQPRRRYLQKIAGTAEEFPGFFGPAGKELRAGEMIDLAHGIKLRIIITNRTGLKFQSRRRNKRKKLSDPY